MYSLSFTGFFFNNRELKVFGERRYCLKKACERERLHLMSKKAEKEMIYYLHIW